VAARKFEEPRWWSDEELRAARDIAEERFRVKRKAEGPDTFAAWYSDVEPHVRSALAVTDSIRRLTEDALASDGTLWQYARFFAGPPISEEDLWTMVGASKSKVMKPAYAADCAEIVNLVIDTVRFPWVSDGRDPTSDELERAVMATTALIANEKLRTFRRMTASVTQEQAVKAVLAAAGYEEVPSKVPVMFMDDMDRGTFSPERRVAGAKCDVPVRLRDGRLLLVECKVSNGPKNGWKRILRETSGKRGKWKDKFGSDAITAAVIAGVLDLACLRDAQTEEVVLYWDHDLSALREFLDAAA
jgi:hypothetical protein